MVKLTGLPAACLPDLGCSATNELCLFGAGKRLRTVMMGKKLLKAGGEKY